MAGVSAAVIDTCTGVLRLDGAIFSIQQYQGHTTIYTGLQPALVAASRMPFSPQTPRRYQTVLAHRVRVPIPKAYFAVWNLTQAGLGETVNHYISQPLFQFDDPPLQVRFSQHPG